MFSPLAISAITFLFILGMVYLRTRMHYPKGAGARLLTGVGAGYFAALVLFLVAGYWVAPGLARSFLPGVPQTPLLGRTLWFLAGYYLFIPVHGMLRARGLAVFRAAAPGERGL
jgi:hypothetical protein